MTATTPLTIGTLVYNRYRINQVLGNGGMGRTYRVSDELDCQKKYALKECSPQTKNEADLEKYYQLFQREANILQKLDHPQIPRFYNQFEEEGRFFLVQQYIQGETYWKALQEQNRAFSESEIIQWLKDLLSVVNYLHQQGVIHRDIAPDNIMKPDDGSKPILIDFGAVKEMESAYSIMGTKIGKQGYSAPEQIRGKISAKSDLYSLGVTAIVLLTGKEPEELFHEESMAWEWSKYTEVSDKLEQVLDKMLAYKPQERYQSVQEILSDLNQQKSIPVNPLPILPTELSLLPDVSSKVNKNTNKSKEKSNRNLIISSIASICLLGVVGVALQSSHIPLLCNQLDNCASDKEFEQQYTQLQKSFTNSFTKAKQAKTFSELQIIRDKLQKNILDLQAIPQKAKIYPQVQQKLTDYQNKLQDLDKTITKEKDAEKQLAQVQILKKSAIEQTQKAKTIEEYKQAKSQWEQVEKQLKNIPLDILIKSEIKTQIQEAQRQQKTIQEKLIAIAENQPKPTPINPKVITQPKPRTKSSIPKARTKSSIPKARTKSSIPKARTKSSIPKARRQSYPKAIPAPRPRIW